MRRRALIGVCAGAFGVAFLVAACGPDSAPTGIASTPSPAESTPLPFPSPSESPAPKERLRFAVIGDWGAATSFEQDVAERMCRWRDNHSFKLVVTTGDNIYPDGDSSDFRESFYRPMDCLLDGGVRFRSVLGNHDIMSDGGKAELAEDRFGFKGRNFVLRKRGVRFVMADSNSLDKSWLRDALVVDDGDRWTVVVFHHPVYSPGTGHGSTPGFRDSLTDLFARKGVDLVLNGHDHIYAVTEPRKKIRYVVTGGSGAFLYGCKNKGFVDACKARHHFLYVVADAEDLRVRAVGPNGEPFDDFTTKGRD